jgi:hypothetical protein
MAVSWGLTGGEGYQHFKYKSQAPFHCVRKRPSV